MKIDLIIPVYNNKLGLYRSLFSLGADAKDLIDVTIVDDASSEDYSSIVEFFQQFVPIRLLKLEKNVGPGLARQYGIDNTNNPYIMFLDCGDYFITPDNISMIMNTIQNNAFVHLFCFGHTQNITVNAGCHQNRMHGKIYKRSFLNTHNIRFNPYGSYLNEDVGFNMAVKLILYQYERDLNQSFIYWDDTPVIAWDTREKESLARHNNNEPYYNKQNYALAVNGGYAIDIARRECVSDPIIAHEIYEIICDMYFKYLSTVSVRQEFTENALNGARKFYWEYFRPLQIHFQDDLIKMYYDTLIQYLNDEYDPIRTKLTALDLVGFLNLLEEQKPIEINAD